MPFFQLLHKWKKFSWSKECDKAFEDLKAYLAHPSILSRPEKEEILYAYIVVTPHAISLVLIRVEEGIQSLVYYVSKSFRISSSKKLSWPSFMPRRSFHIIFRLILWLFLHNCHCKHYFGDLTTLGEWPNEELCWGHLISSIYLEQ